MDTLTKDQRRRNMQAIKSKNTKIECTLAKALYSKGYRYRKNDSMVMGKPDLSFKKYKIAVFCDSEFFHGKDWEVQRLRLQDNKEYWLQKIESNIRRDSEVNSRLQADGWMVLRFWGKDILKNLIGCVERIEIAIQARKVQD